MGWVIMVIAVTGCLGSAWGLYRYNAGRDRLRYVLIVLSVMLLVPAPVPAYPEFLAPAFMVALFEWAFQDNGRPDVALRILGMGMIGGILISAGVGLVTRLIARRRQAS